MGLFDRIRRRERPGVRRAASTADIDHLEQWAAAHRGVEAYVEPRTTVTETTVVLVAHDGEWTRRRVDDGEAARRLGKRLKIPVYDVARMGYPQRMRDYTARQRILREREQGADSQ
ncbi:MAG: oxidoreductase [Pseudonocardiaceae bacterium]